MKLFYFVMETLKYQVLTLFRPHFFIFIWLDGKKISALAYEVVFFQFLMQMNVLPYTRFWSLVSCNHVQDKWEVGLIVFFILCLLTDASNLIFCDSLKNLVRSAVTAVCANICWICFTLNVPMNEYILYSIVTADH